MDAHLRKIATLLLNHRQHGAWMFLQSGRNTTKEDANRFFAGAVLDYQIPSMKAWDNGKRLCDEIAGDASLLWEFISRMTLFEWNAKWREYNLHRFPKAHERLHRIAHIIMVQFNGDPRKIWSQGTIEHTGFLLSAIDVGEQISRMILGALFDSGIIEGKSDVKVDIHVRRVLGRSARGHSFETSETNEVTSLTRQMSPDNPWLLDDQLYSLGQHICTSKKPDCSQCYLSPHCHYSETNK